VSDVETLLQRQNDLLEQLVKQSGTTVTHTRTVAEASTRQRRLISLGCLWGFVGVVYLSQGVITGYNRVAETWWGKQLGLADLGGAAAVSPDTTPLAKGDRVGDWVVTSGMGPRVSPGGVGSTDHKGVDLANGAGATLGAPLYAPFKTRVKCGRTGGGGIEATITGDGVKLRLLHLADCLPGPVKAGSVFAYVGNTGTATTGPHLHLEQYSPDLTTPTKQWAAALLGVELGFSVESYKAAIATKESGHNYQAVNPDSGALGKFQFMPDTMRSNAQACLGVTPSNQQFLADPELQNKVMDCYLNRALTTIQKKTKDPVTQCRMLASHHYSGNPDLWDDTRPQATNGNQYPSIADYTAAICKGGKTK